VQIGDALTVAAPAGGVSSGDLVAIGDTILGVAKGDAAAGDPVVLQCVGVVALPKVAGTAFAPGDELYWDDEGSELTTTPTAIPVGPCTETAGAAAATARVRLRGQQLSAGLRLAKNPVNFAVHHEASPTGGQAHVVASAHGPYLAADLVGEADSGVGSVAGGDIVPVVHDADPATNLDGVPVYVLDGRLCYVSPFERGAHVRTMDGRYLVIEHDADAATGADAVVNDAAALAERFEATLDPAEDLTQATSTTRFADAVV
jgi:predicted RecA/RadA family phage recombinase